jgi:D-alanyl-lipoteichoic acid acyltransferase DltB (MBOAT superfamily)
MTFNDFIWQVSPPQKGNAENQVRNPTTITRREQLSYAFRFIICLLTMETMLHSMYVVAIKDTSAWDGDSPAELSMIGLWNLVVVWLKVCLNRPL